jgi:acetylornithine deacetylase/succinyl-diaminopimelate desuccinylase-like protein
MTEIPPPVAALMTSPAYAKMRATLGREHDRTIEDIIALTQVPSPPFGEAARASAYLQMLRAHRLAEVEMDAIGNVMGIRRGSGKGPLIAIAAHLDTVFPTGTDLTVRREGTKLHAPGVGDDTRSLAVLLAFIRALDAAEMRTTGDLLFVGDVGEEGLGDLRGVRYLFTEGRYRARIKAFFTVDSPDIEVIAVGGIGSKRYHVTFGGPGGHSFGAFGTVNPLYAMAQAMLELSRTHVPANPKTTFCASVVGGGTSINSIPNQVWMDIDLRSQSVEELARLEARFRAIVEHAVAAENHARSTQTGSIAAS